jgi:magnesium-transporting ATPase (P-type)
VSQHKDHDHAEDQHGKPTETALEEVLREVEDAENRTRDSERRHRGEAGEAITPNTRAQEQSEGD